MSGHKYISNAGKLFDDDDVDDETFVNSYREKQPASKPSSTAYGGHLSDLERQRQIMLERQREIEQRTIDSTSRSIGILRESEHIGIATAEELSLQREKLQNTNKRLDEINTNLNYSQKHINGIKSVFYSFKNYLSGKDLTPVRSLASSDAKSPKIGPSNSKLEETIRSSKSFQEDNFSSHPATRLRGLNEQTMATPGTDSKRVNDILDKNLDEMANAIARLKGLGTALGQEIDQQNELIDIIADKTDTADIKIGKQVKDMNKLL